MSDVVSKKDGNYLIKGQKPMKEVRAIAKTISGQFFKTELILAGINKKSMGNPNEVFQNLYAVLLREDFIYSSISRLRGNKGINTSGTDNRTIDSFSVKDVNSIRGDLHRGEYKFAPARRIMIPKPGKSTKRPLGIPVFYDKIVQEMIRAILEAIYEPMFINKHQNVNFGFRPGRSVQDAIEYIRNKAKGTPWCIEGDIKGAYDTINHDVLIGIVEERISDLKFTNLLRKALTAGIVFEDKFEHTLLRTPQGGIVSPILFNIYMSKLDEYVLGELTDWVSFINQQEKRTDKPVNKRYTMLRDQAKRVKARFRKGNVEDKKQLQFLSDKMVHTDYVYKSKAKIRITYCRYMDDWTLFTNGSRNFAEQAKTKISEFLKNELKLELSEEKTKVTEVGMDPVKFLGFTLFSNSQKQRIRKIKKKDGTTAKTRTTGGNLTVGIDYQRLESTLITKQFRREHGQDKTGVLARSKPPWTVLHDFEIIDNYNSVIRGLWNYFFIADKLRTLDQATYILYYSCIHTLAHKRKKSVKEIFRIYGNPARAAVRPDGSDPALNTKEEKICTLIDTNEAHRLMQELRSKRIKKKMKDQSGKKLVTKELPRTLQKKCIDQICTRNRTEYTLKNNTIATENKLIDNFRGLLFIFS